MGPLWGLWLVSDLPLWPLWPGVPWYAGIGLNGGWALGCPGTLPPRTSTVHPNRTRRPGDGGAATP